MFIKTKLIKKNKVQISNFAGKKTSSLLTSKLLFPMDGFQQTNFTFIKALVWLILTQIYTILTIAGTSIIITLLFEYSVCP